MSKKNNNKKTIDSTLLPNTNTGMKNYFSNYKNRVCAYKKIIQIIEQSIDTNESIAEIYRFDDSLYSVVIHENDFKENVDFIFNKLIELEEYELCSYVKTVKQKVDDINDTLKTNYV